MGKNRWRGQGWAKIEGGVGLNDIKSHFFSIQNLKSNNFWFLEKKF